MPQLTFMQNMSDKASRLLPSAFSEIVEDTTSEILTAPDYENIMFICDQTNQRAENAKDVILAIRRRIESTNPKVQYFTIILLDALIKNCYEDLHNAVADSPALQNVLIQIAVRTPIRDGEFEAKKAALQLILNMSYWFIGATEDKTKMLCKLADEVRAETTPLVFEDIESDPTYQLKRAPPTKVQRRQQNGASASGSSSTQRNTNAIPNPPSHQRVVEAIPVHQYTGEQISGMLDSCMLLSEMLNAAEQEHRGIIGDDIITSIAVQVRQDHRKLSILLSSGAEMENLDVLLSVADSQTAIIQRMSSMVERQGKNLRDVASMGAEEDENSSVVLHQSSQQNPPQQITRANAVPTSSTAADTTNQNTNYSPFQRSAQPRQAMTADNDAEEMHDSSSPPMVPQAHGPVGYSPASGPSPTNSSPKTTQRKADQQESHTTNDQELDDFFGAPAPAAGDLSTPFIEGGNNHGPSSSAAPALLAKESVPNNDFFETNNAPSSSVQPSTLGSVTGEGDEFDDFLNSRLPK